MCQLANDCKCLVLKSFCHVFSLSVLKIDLYLLTYTRFHRKSLHYLYQKHLFNYFFRAKDQVKERIDTLSASINAPSAPSEDVVDTVNQNGHLTTEDQLEILSHDDGNPWEDVKELLVLEDSKYMLVVCDTVN